MVREKLAPMRRVVLRLASGSKSEGVGWAGHRREEALGQSPGPPWGDLEDFMGGRSLTSPARPACVQTYSCSPEDSPPADGGLDTCWSCTCCWAEAEKAETGPLV